MIQKYVVFSNNSCKEAYENCEKFILFRWGLGNYFQLYFVLKPNFKIK